MELVLFSDFARGSAWSLRHLDDLVLLGVSYAIASLACYVFLRCAALITPLQPSVRRHLWVAGGAVAMGGGVWGVHFAAIVAGAPIANLPFDLKWVFVSAVLAFLAAATVLHLAARRDVNAGHRILCSIAAALGIAGMHYAGMAAVRLDGLVRFDLVLFAAFVVAAAVLAVLAPRLPLRISLWSGQEAGLSPNGGRALILGLAVTTILFGAMASTSSVESTASPASALRAGPAVSAGATTVIIALILLMAIAFVILQRTRRNEASFRLLFEKSPNVMWVYDREDFRIIAANEAACAAYGYSAEEFGRLTLFDVVAAEEHDRLRVLMAGMNYNDTALRDQGLWRNVTKGGTSIDAAVTSGAITLGDQPARLVVVKDVTQQRQAEARLAQAEANLRQSQKLEAIGQLTGGVAHDFNNVLAIMMIKLERLADELPADSPAQATIASALAAGERAADVVSRLMTFARRRPLEPEETAIDELFRGLARLLPTALPSEVALSIDIADGLWRCWLDRNGLEMALLNLAVNARDAMPSGGVLSIAAYNRAITVEEAAARPGLRVGQWVEIAVRDSGIGMSAEVQSRVFEPFFTTKGDGQGTGLGMAMVYGFVHQSGGFLTLDSAPGKGTAISLYLPATGVVTPAPQPDTGGHARPLAA